MTFSEFRAKLKNVTRTGDGGDDAPFSAKCPGHDDETNSLAVRKGKRVEFVCYCFAGCSFERIIRGLEFRT